MPWNFSAYYNGELGAPLYRHFMFFENIVDPVTGEVTFDAGSDILHGENHLDHTNYFLQGNRVNRTLASFTATWQPIRQYFVEVRVFGQSIRRPAEGSEEKPVTVWGTIRVDY